MSKPKKLIAISPEDYRVLLDRVEEVSKMKASETPVEKKLSSLDAKMNEILNNNTLSDWDKLMAYTQVMQDYMEYSKQDTAEPTRGTQPHVLITPPVGETNQKKIKKVNKTKHKVNSPRVEKSSADYEYLMKNWITL